MFGEMSLREPLLRGIYGYGFEQPTNIQQRALLPCISGHDVIVQAPSSTGKTISLVIAILQQLDMDCKDCQALILAPTRALAQQIHEVVLALGEQMGVTCHACVVSLTIHEGTKSLQAGVQVVVGTPGRIYDLLKRSVSPLNAVASEHIRVLVLDEADELSCRGYNDQIQDIVRMLPNSIQVIATSATMPGGLLEEMTKFMRDPVKILTKTEDRTLEGIRQFYVNVKSEEYKLDALYDLFDTLTITQAIVYCNTCEKVHWLSEKLRAHHLTVSVLDLTMNDEQRNEAIKAFRTGSGRILVRTDRPEADTDIPQISPVINYDLPADPASYVRRIGRRGRFGRNGTAISFITNDEQQSLHHIEQYYNTQIDELPRDIVDFI